MNIAATLEPEEAMVRTWDVLVVGAGPAGAMLARELARLGSKVLLLDKASFPRAKVCGCCLSGSTLSALRSVGLGAIPAQLGAVPLRSMRLADRSRAATLRLRDGVALSRNSFDAALVQAAVASGADFLPQTAALCASHASGVRNVECRRDGGQLRLHCRIVVAADGLAGHLLTQEIPARIQNGSRLGVGVVVDAAGDFYRPGVIYMACGRLGYVGLVRLEDNRLDVAAALDPAATRREGPGETVANILAEAGWPAIGGVEGPPWRGTPLLTRRPLRLGAEQLFVVGDAAGYVEPFTGEGMAWALNSAIALAPIVKRAAAGWSPIHLVEWERTHHGLVGRRQRSCRWLARALRSPFLTRLLVTSLALAPALANPFLRRLNRALKTV